MEKPEENLQKHCYNCNSELSDTAKYCQNCGQKHTTGKIPVYEFVYDFLKNVFNIDAKLPKTIFYLLFFPGKLTNEFFKGKHKSYLKPTQVFVFMTLLCFTLIAFRANNFNTNFSLKGEDETLKLNINYNEGENQYYYNKGIDTSKFLVDSLLMEVKSQVDINTQSIIDTTFQTFLQTDSMVVDSMFIPLIQDAKGRNSLKIPKGEIIISDGKALLKKYEIDNFITKIMFVQTIKSIKNERAVVDYLISRLSWTFFLLVPLFALILKLVYIRRKQFYVEHLVFTFHFHAFLFSVISLIILFENIFPTELKIGLLTYVPIYLWISMKIYYKQSIWKTLLKFFLLYIGYIILLTIAAIITMTAIFVLF